MAFSALEMKAEKNGFLPVTEEKDPNMRRVSRIRISLWVKSECPARAARRLVNTKLHLTAKAG